jgi:hypothetical protein
VIVVALFVEDDAQRSLLSGLIARIARCEGSEVSIELRNVEGGSGRTLKSLKTYAADLRAKITFADILVVGIDADAVGSRQRRHDADAALRGYAGRVVMALPDPHIEKWYLLDPRAVSRSLGQDYATTLPPKGTRNFKRALLDAFDRAGIRPPSGGSEFGEDIATVMDLSAARIDADFGRFVADLRSAIRLAALLRDTEQGTGDAPDGT